MAVFDDDMATAQTISKQRLDRDGHRRPGFAHPDHIERVILAQIIGVVSDMELVTFAPHMRANGLAGVDRLQSGLENRVQIMSQLLSALHGLPSLLSRRHLDTTFHVRLAHRMRCG